MIALVKSAEYSLYPSFLHQHTLNAAIEHIFFPECGLGEHERF
ncbi:MAG: hypothetical protein R3B05_01130 [Nitrospira sp.]